MTRLRRLLGRQSGYSLVELITVMAILGTILGGLTTAFVQGSTAELHANRRVQAQLEATAAFDRLRRDIHCASSAPGATSSPSSAITLTVPVGCDSSGSIRWCSLARGSGYALYRQSGASCSTAGKLYADSLTSSAIFSYFQSVADTSLAKVHVDMRVNVNPTKAVDLFQLTDDIVLRNSTR
jgi:prepilin-type N-terminal cleavage/methylation domain-containing protein